MRLSLPSLVLSGCLWILLAAGPLRAQTGTTITGSIVSGGLTRVYYLYVPNTYRQGTPVPLLFNLHGFTLDGKDQESRGDFRPIADTANFLVVHPNGTTTDPVLNYQRSWNTFGTGSKVDDVGFLSALLDTLRAKYSIDVNRVYSTGFSNGAFMSYELACELSNRIAAVASVAGAIVDSRLRICAPQHPTPILEIHGTADGTIDYNGGKPDAHFLSIPRVLSYWVGINGCATLPSTVTLPHNPSYQTTVERSVWSGGRNGSLVMHYKVINGDHSWPGGPGVKRDINASVEVWRFLRQFRLNQLTTPLPVTLTSFTATCTGTGVQLDWQTASELHADHFDVERSLDGQAFATLRTVAATGTSATTRAYGWLDTEPATWDVSPLYYRLHSVDQDGTAAYAPVQVVDWGGAAAKLALFPNPTANTATLTGAGAGELVQVFDSLGRLVETSTADATGKAVLSLPPRLPAGMYLVRTGGQAVRLLRN